MTSEKPLAAHRLDNLTDSVWVEISELVREYEPVNLGQGFPDFGAPVFMRNALAQTAASEDVRLHQYTRAFGHPRLVRALSTLYQRLTGLTIDPLTEIVITTGADQAIYCTVMALIDRGDEVVIIEPYFDCYEPMVRMAGGTPIFIPLRCEAMRNGGGASISSADWTLDFAELEAKFSDKTKMIIINTPNNPLGKIYSRAELEAIARLCAKFNVIALMDEVYEWVSYQGVEHIRMATLPGMWERTVTVGSAGKSFSVTGWKIGWAYAPSRLMRLIQLFQQNCVFSTNTPGQEAVAIGFESQTRKLFDDEQNCYWTELRQTLQSKRDRMAAFLASVDMAPVVPEGGYFMVANFAELSKRIDFSCESTPKGAGRCMTNDYRFVRWLAKNRRLQGIPMSTFYSAEHKSIGENFIRFCFAKRDETLAAAEKIIRELKRSLPQAEPDANAIVQR